MQEGRWTAFLQVFRASNIKVSKRLRRGVGHGSREGAGVACPNGPPPKSARGATVRKYCVFTVKVALESENEQTAAEGREVTVAVIVWTAFLQVFRASNIKVSKRLQRGVGDGCREAVGLHVYSALWLLMSRADAIHESSWERLF